jgi:hypothetical protein
MAEFSADRVPSHMPVRFSENTGNVGAQAAQRGQHGGGKPKLGRSQPEKGKQGKEIGRPQPQQELLQPQDYSYLSVALQHFNMKGLGRDVPYLVWANLTGNYRRFAEPGRVPFDILED